MDITFLHNHPLVSSLDEAELARIGELMERIDLEPGDRLCVEGERPKGLMLLRQGTVRIAKRSDNGSEYTLAQLEGPTVIGEMELITGEPCSATATAESRATGGLIPHENFVRMLEAGDSACSKVLRNISRVVVRRLEASNEHMVRICKPEQLRDFETFKKNLFANWSF